MRALMMKRCQMMIIITLTLLVVLNQSVNTALAQYYPPLPSSTPRIVQVGLSYPEPQSFVTVNLAQSNPEHAVKEIKIYFKKPVSTASLTIYQPVDKPAELPEPGPALTYFSIQAPKTLLDNVESAVIIFAVDKLAMSKKGVGEDTLRVNGFYEGEWHEMVTSKVDENQMYLFLEIKTTTPGLHYAIAGPPSPLLPMVVLFLVAGSMVGVAAIYLRVSGRRGMWPPHS